MPFAQNTQRRLRFATLVTVPLNWVELVAHLERRSPSLAATDRTGYTYSYANFIIVVPGLPYYIRAFDIPLLISIAFL